MQQLTLHLRIGDSQERNMEEKEDSAEISVAEPEQPGKFALQKLQSLEMTAALTARP